MKDKKNTWEKDSPGRGWGDKSDAAVYGGGKTKLGWNGNGPWKWDACKTGES